LTVQYNIANNSYNDQCASLFDVVMIANSSGGVIQNSEQNESSPTLVVSSAGVSNLVLLAAPGDLFYCYAINLTATAGYLLLINTNTDPADGAVTPLDVAILPANGQATIDYKVLPAYYSNGIVAVVSSNTSPFDKTTGTITAFIRATIGTGSYSILDFSDPSGTQSALFELLF
jgi:hypothetical protein